jgi:hypothetical protein
LVSEKAPFCYLTPVVTVGADVIQLRAEKVNLALKSSDNLVVFRG